MVAPRLCLLPRFAAVCHILTAISQDLWPTQGSLQHELGILSLNRPSSFDESFSKQRLLLDPPICRRSNPRKARLAPRNRSGR